MRMNLDYIPKGWDKVKIPQVLFFQEGPGVRKWQFTEEGIKLLNVGNINNGKIDLSTTSIHLSEEEATGKYSHFLIDEGDLLIACSGIVVNNFHNKIAFIEKEHLPLCLNTSTMRFKALSEQVDLNYFKYYLQTVHFTSQLQKLITGSAQLNFGPSHIKKIDVLLPPIDTQKRIASILDDAQALKQKTEKLLAEYDELAQSIFLDMFGDPITNPKGWEISRVKNVCSRILGGGTPRKSNEEYFNGEIPWVTPKDMKRLYIDDSKIRITEKAIQESSAKLIPKYSVLMVIRSGILKKKLPVSINTVDVTINQDMKAYVTNDRFVIPSYLLYFFMNSSKYLLSKVRAVTADNIEFNQIKEMEIPVPSIEVQTDFHNRLEVLKQQKELAKQELKESEDLYNCLLQKAFKGELN